MPGLQIKLSPKAPTTQSLSESSRFLLSSTPLLMLSCFFSAPNGRIMLAFALPSLVRLYRPELASMIVLHVAPQAQRWAGGLCNLVVICCSHGAMAFMSGGLSSRLFLNCYGGQSQTPTSGRVVAVELSLSKQPSPPVKAEGAGGARTAADWSMAMRLCESNLLKRSEGESKRAVHQTDTEGGATQVQVLSCCLGRRYLQLMLRLFAFLLLELCFISRFTFH
ncbi:hypothetical protein BDU57DRAFT_93362 [Ampelomyces quisqualis]|uniref:Uncharacterized protein n=1 Tax=Ampelomyces quisqualis TaxID=50730 RepID=A0A6A5Q9Z5_AMPQU|nr:hypothetical protein BDU57DRAFT_93362 [Ampelomyces quisqualis]